MLTDIEIAQQTKLIPIDQLAHEYGLSDDQFIPYGRDKAKVALDTSNEGQTYSRNGYFRYARRLR